MFGLTLLRPNVVQAFIFAVVLGAMVENTHAQPTPQPGHARLPTLPSGPCR